MLVDPLDTAEDPLERALHLLRRLREDGQRAQRHLPAHRQQRHVEKGAGGGEHRQRAPAEAGQVAPDQQISRFRVVVLGGAS